MYGGVETYRGRILAMPQARAGYWFLGASDDDRTGPSRSRATSSGASRDERVVSIAPSDAALVDRVRSGDAESFRLLYVDLYRMAWETAYSYVRSDDAAEDVVHDVFLQMWADRARWRVHGSVRAYVLSAVRHKAMNVLRHERVVRRDVERDAAVGSAGVLGEVPPSPDDVVRTSDLHAVLEAVIAAFPAMRREVVVLRWRQGLSVSEIAQVLGVSVNAVSIHLTRAREVLLPLLREPAE